MTRSSPEVAEDSGASRQRLAESLAQLGNQLAPKHLVEELLERVSSPQDAPFLERIEKVVREHPLPMMLIGLGSALLLGSGFRRHPSDPSSSAAQPKKPNGHDTSAELQEAKPESQEAKTPPAANIRESLTAVADTFVETARERMRQNASGKLDEFVKHTSKGVEAAGEQVAGVLEKSLDKAMSSFKASREKYPLASSIAALALGLALNAAESRQSTKAAAKDKPRA